MKIKYNNQEYNIDKDTVGKKVDGYLFEGNIYPSLPDKAIERGGIYTEDGVISVCTFKGHTAALIAILLSILLIIASVLWWVFNYNTINVKAKYNAKMEQVDGFSDINLVGNGKDVSVYIKGDNWVTEQVVLAADQNIATIYTGLPMSEEPVNVTVIYAAGKASEEFPATIKVISEGKKEEVIEGEDEPVVEEEPPMEEVIIE